MLCCIIFYSVMITASAKIERLESRHKADPMPRADARVTTATSRAAMADHRRAGLAKQIDEPPGL